MITAFKKRGEALRGLKEGKWLKVAFQARTMYSKVGKTWGRVNFEPFMAIINQCFLTIWLTPKKNPICNSKQRNLWRGNCGAASSVTFNILVCFYSQPVQTASSGSLNIKILKTTNKKSERGIWKSNFGKKGLENYHNKT